MKLLEEFGQCRELQKYNINILFITDTHNCLPYDKETLEYIQNVKDYDYCILLGDHSADDLYEITKIIPKDNPNTKYFPNKSTFSICSLVIL